MSIFTNLKVNEQHILSLGQVAWSAPSNIALVKYWGKKSEQIPCNPSVSFTLDQARTSMHFSWQGRTYLKGGPRLKFLFDSRKAPKFEQKIQDFLVKLADEEGFSYLYYFDLTINARNTFPHSAGIASSASSMAALSLCLLSMRAEIFKDLVVGTPDFYRKSSYVARLASGSACRSIYPYAASWGKSPAIKEGHDLWATPITQLSERFKTFKDAILLIDSGIKKVSSTEGHALMQNHPHAHSRFERAKQNTSNLIQSLKDSKPRNWIALVEAEALELHGLMMTSNPPYILMRPNTLACIEKIQAYRQNTGIEMGFTLDAGANIHLLYPDSESEEVESFIKDDLLEHCEDEQVIYDQIGDGPRQEVYSEL
jgi:diphosphomevalonate decarboxylase